MHSTAVRILARFTGLLALTVCAATPFVAHSRAATAAEHQLLAASDPRFHYEGRFDQTDPAAPVVIWQASRIQIEFEGDSLGLQFGEPTGQNFFDAGIDGKTSLVAIREGQAAEGVRFTGLGQGRHRLILFKRSEASAGAVRFHGIELAGGAQAFAPALTPHPLAMLFIGDSITAGACNEDGAIDQWADRSTHNNARSYGALTAGAFSADYRNIAVSGMGVVLGWVEPKAGEIWNRVYPRASSPRADLSSWTPDVVFVNLGENDDSFTTAKGLPFPATGYTNAYVDLVSAIRQAYPATHIVILRGGMFGGAQSARLREPWEAAVRRIEAADAKASHFVFQRWSANHPRVADHRAMADELIAWLKAQPFIAPAQR